MENATDKKKAPRTSIRSRKNAMDVRTESPATCQDSSDNALHSKVGPSSETRVILCGRTFGGGLHTDMDKSWVAIQRRPPEKDQVENEVSRRYGIHKYGISQREQ